MAQAKCHKVLGVGHYEAHWIGKSLLVRLVATGILPCSNYVAQLEKRPERVLPPMWDMVFFVEDYCEKALRPFSCEVTMFNGGGAETISVHDALGAHEVPIEHRVPGAGPGPVWETAADLDLYVVYAKLPQVGDAHHGCIVVPADNFVPAIYYRVFGPAAKADCDQFALSHCSTDVPKSKQSGGEIPWPLVVED